MSDLLTPALDRRGFFKRAGLGAVVASAALQACDSEELVPAPDDTTITLDFSNDFGVLNYAYLLEQLEAAFYAQVLATPFNDITDAERTVFTDLSIHENIHRDFLAGALGTNAIPTLTVDDLDFSLIDFTSRTSVLTTAITFEDLGVAAYNGAGQILRDANLLAIAGKIVSVEARHASAIRDLILNAGDAPANFERTAATVGEADANVGLPQVVLADGLDRAISPNAVLLSADPYLKRRIRPVGL